MPSPAEQLLELYESGGWTFVEALVSEQQEESLHLDFKRKRDPRTASLDKDDRKNLGEALSGFANAEGGLLVWGVDARISGEIDAVVGLEPLQDVRGFLSHLTRLTPELVSPAVQGIRHVPIYDPNVENRGIVATLIPASDAGPHMARGPGQQRYYRRTESSFRPLEHYEIADLFGRRAHPLLAVRTEYRCGLANFYQDFSGGNVGVRLRFVIENRGRGFARFLCFTLGKIENWEDPYAASNFGGGVLMPRKAPDGWWIRVAGGVDFILYPDDEFEVGSLHFNIEHTDNEFPDLRVQYSIVAAETPTTVGEFRLAGEEIRSAAAAAFASKNIPFRPGP
jgi:hypothetical protein